MKKKIFSTDQILLEFNNRSRLSQLISKYVQLEPRGNSHVGRCPFHEEKTPSLVLMMKKVYFIALAVKWEEMQLHFLKNIIIFLF